MSENKVRLHSSCCLPVAHFVRTTQTQKLSVLTLKEQEPRNICHFSLLETIYQLFIKIFC